MTPPQAIEVAKSEGVSQAKLMKLASHESLEVRRGVAENPETPVPVLSRLAQDLPELVAAHPQLALGSLAGAGALDKLTLEATAALLPQPTCPSGVFARAASALKRSAGRNVTAADLFLGACVLLHPRCPTPLQNEVSAALDKAYVDPDHLLGLRVSLHLAANPHSPQELLLELMQHDDASLVKLASQNPALPDDAQESLCWLPRAAPRRALAKQKDLPERLLWILVEDPDEKLRAGLARRADLPLALRSVLARDDSSYVREAVARSAAATLEMLALLAEDESPVVRDVVARNRKTPKALRERVLSSLAAFESKTGR